MPANTIIRKTRDWFRAYPAGSGSLAGSSAGARITVRDGAFWRKRRENGDIREPLFQVGSFIMKGNRLYYDLTRFKDHEEKGKGL